MVNIEQIVIIEQIASLSDLRQLYIVNHLNKQRVKRIPLKYFTRIKLYYMCSSLVNRDAKNCTCKFAHLCARRQKIESNETKTAPSIPAILIELNFFKKNLPPVYTINTNSVSSLINQIS